MNLPEPRSLSRRDFLATTGTAAALVASTGLPRLAAAAKTPAMPGYLKKPLPDPIPLKIQSPISS